MERRVADLEEEKKQLKGAMEGRVAEARGRRQAEVSDKERQMVEMEERHALQLAEAWVTEVALALGNAPRPLRRWLIGSLLATAASALPLAASFSRQ